MTNIEAEEMVQAHQHLVGKVFEHHGSKRKCKIDTISKNRTTGSSSNFEVLVSATPMEKIASTSYVEELEYFLGTFRQIS